MTNLQDSLPHNSLPQNNLPQNGSNGSKHVGAPGDGSTPNGQRAFETLGQFLAHEGRWQPRQIGEEYIYQAFYTGQNGHYTCYAQIMIALEQFLFYAILPVKVPDDLRPAAAEFITRANFGLRIGNFELDFADGEIRYKSSLDFEGETLTPNLIRNTIYPAVMTLDHYFPGLMSVIYGGRAPLDAINDIEGSRSTGSHSTDQPQDGSDHD